ncbi:hypothetical protein [Streptomyces syringium]|uniref:hypothetical protein n=1 Tax=Streptomyces syringium TaxID=76729 RepID=UPI0033CBD21E
MLRRSLVRDLLAQGPFRAQALDCRPESLFPGAETVGLAVGVLQILGTLGVDLIGEHGQVGAHRGQLLTYRVEISGWGIGGALGPENSGVRGLRDGLPRIAVGGLGRLAGALLFFVRGRHLFGVLREQLLLLAAGGAGRAQREPVAARCRLRLLAQRTDRRDWHDSAALTAASRPALAALW